MDIPVQSPAKGMDGCENARRDAFLSGHDLQWLCCQGTELPKQVPVDLKQRPELGRHGEGDVLPLRVGQDHFLLLNPLVGELLATGVAETGLAAKTDPLFVGTFPVTALPGGVAHDKAAAGQYLTDAFYDHGAQLGFMFVQVAGPELTG